VPVGEVEVEMDEKPYSFQLISCGSLDRPQLTFPVGLWNHFSTVSTCRYSGKHFSMLPHLECPDKTCIFRKTVSPQQIQCDLTAGCLSLIVRCSDRSERPLPFGTPRAQRENKASASEQQSKRQKSVPCRQTKIAANSAWSNVNRRICAAHICLENSAICSY
jgi:hypothetical protein